MKKHFITGLLATFAIAASAQSFTEWQNPEVNAVNRAPMHTNYFAYESADAAARGAKEHSSNYMTLNGIWKFVPRISGKWGSTTRDGAIWPFPVCGN